MCDSLPIVKCGSINSTADESHILDEAVFDMEIEKSLLDTYAYRDMDNKSIIYLKDYNLSAAEVSKNLYNRINNRIINESESTQELRDPNFQEELKYIIEAKNKSNSFIGTMVDQACEGYRKILVDIYDLYKNIKDSSKFSTDPDLKAIREQEKLVMSNLSLAFTKKGMYKEAIELDKEIIDKMDTKFDKSYGRLVNSYLKLGFVDEATKYADILRKFSTDIVSKYKDVLAELDIQHKKADDVFIS